MPGTVEVRSPLLGEAAGGAVTLGGGGERGGAAAVEGDHLVAALAVGAADQHEGVAAEVAVPGLDGGHDGGGGDGGVDRVAAAAQDLDAGLGGEVVGGGDHAAVGHEEVTRRAVVAEFGRGGAEVLGHDGFAGGHGNYPLTPGPLPPVATGGRGRAGSANAALMRPRTATRSI